MTLEPDSEHSIPTTASRLAAALWAAAKRTWRARLDHGGGGLVYGRGGSWRSQRTQPGFHESFRDARTRPSRRDERAAVLPRGRVAAVSDRGHRRRQGDHPSHVGHLLHWSGAVHNHRTGRLVGGLTAPPDTTGGLDVWRAAFSLAGAARGV